MKEYFKPLKVGSFRYFQNWKDFVKYRWRWVKWFIQRGSRGWADCDVWSIDCYISEIMPDMIDRLQSNGHGYPMELTQEEWDKILVTMKEGFLASKRMQNLEYEHEPGDTVWPQYDEDKKKFDEALELFCKYYFDLWD